MTPGTPVWVSFMAATSLLYSCWRSKRLPIFAPLTVVASEISLEEISFWSRSRRFMHLKNSQSPCKALSAQQLRKSSFPYAYFLWAMMFGDKLSVSGTGG